jgi:hypothetical protein|tara:strand:- start:110 stop:505 length:396 start_codon:yes stop_codon:yes gene_type:complete
MDKNIFLKNKKYNPDIAKNYSKAISDRENTKYSYKEEFINPSIINKNDKVYKSDKEETQIDLLIKKKLEERQNQEFNFKPTKNFVASSNPNDFKEYNDLKNQQSKYENKQKESSDNFNNILDDLKDLGILK